MIQSEKSVLNRLQPTFVAVFALDLSTTVIRSVSRGIIGFGLEASGLAFLIIVQIVTSPEIGWALGWLLYGVAFFSLLPRIYPGRSGTLLKDAPATRAAIAIVIVAVGIDIERRQILLEAQLSEITGSPLPSGANISVFVVLFVAALLVHSLFAIRHRGDFRIPNGSLHSFSGTIESVTGNFYDNSDFSTDSNIEMVLQIADFFLITIVQIALLSLAAISANLLFPIAELVSLVALALIWYSPNWTRERLRAFDIEERLLRSVQVVRFGPKGILTLFGLVLGMLPAVVTCFFIVTAIPALIGVLFLGRGFTVSELLFLIPAVAIMAAYGWYSLWYWFRILQRMPFFLSKWTNTPPGLRFATVLRDVDEVSERSYWQCILRQLPRIITAWTASLAGFRSTSTGSDHNNNGAEPENDELLTRPPGMLAQPTLIFLLFNHAIPLRTEGGDLPYYILLYSISLLFLWWIWRSIRWTLESPPQPPLEDNFVIPAAIFMLYGGYSFSLTLGDGASLVQALSSLADYLFSLVVLFYLFDILDMVAAQDESLRRWGEAVGGVLLFLIILRNALQGHLYITVFTVFALAILFVLLYWPTHRQNEI